VHFCELRSEGVHRIGRFVRNILRFSVSFDCDVTFENRRLRFAARGRARYEKSPVLRRDFRRARAVERRFLMHNGQRDDFGTRIERGSDVRFDQLKASALTP
jgi:hypothetical protein